MTSKRILNLGSRPLRTTIVPALGLALVLTPACADDDIDESGTEDESMATATVGATAGTASGTGLGPATMGATAGMATAGDMTMGTLGTGDLTTGDATGGTGDTGQDGGDNYEFTSRFAAESSVSYAGQTARHALIATLTSHIASLTQRIDEGALVATPGKVAGELLFFYEFDSESAASYPHAWMTTPPALQTTLAGISSGKTCSARSLDKIPWANTPDWTMSFAGWQDGGAFNPDSLIRHFIARIDELAVARTNGNVPLDPTGQPIADVFVDAQGRDYRQLLQKFLLGAVAFSQGTDDYLDDSDPGKGLLADNAAAADGKVYTELEHAWDEGFGYFGAARNCLDFTHEEAAGKGGRPQFASGYFDTNADGAIDLTAEMNLGHAVNAAKRDLGSAPTAPTQFRAEAYRAFLDGRRLITNAAGPLDAAAMAQLSTLRDIAVWNWELAIAATVVHYINDTLQDMGKFGTPEYSFSDHAKHWSELEGFALGLQFNPRSPLTEAQFADFSAKIGDAPVLPSASANAIADYRLSLLGARAILEVVYGFSPDNIGDINGENGW